MKPTRKPWTLGSVSTTFLLIFFACLLVPQLLRASLQKLGDLDENGEISVLDLVRLINHINGTTRLTAAKLPFADINGDGFVDRSDVDGLANLILGIPIPPKPATMEPATGTTE